MKCRSHPELDQNSVAEEVAQVPKTDDIFTGSLSTTTFKSVDDDFPSLDLPDGPLNRRVSEIMNKRCFFQMSAENANVFTSNEVIFMKS